MKTILTLTKEIYQILISDKSIMILSLFFILMLLDLIYYIETIQLNDFINVILSFMILPLLMVLNLTAQKR